MLEMLTDVPSKQNELAAFTKKDVNARNLIVNRFSDNVLIMIKDKRIKTN